MVAIINSTNRTIKKLNSPEPNLNAEAISAGKIKKSMKAQSISSCEVLINTIKAMEMYSADIKPLRIKLFILLFMSIFLCSVSYPA